MDLRLLSALPRARSITLDKDQLPTTLKTTAAGQTVTATMSKSGAPVTIAARPASEVGTLNLPG